MNIKMKLGKYLCNKINEKKKKKIWEDNESSHHPSRENKIIFR